MRVTILGSGTSTGVPMPGCTCEVCTSGKPRNERLRTSAVLQFFPDRDRSLKSSEVPLNILIDTSTDLRAQALRAKLSRIDAVLYTHAHADHIFGIDDLRSFNFIQRSAIPLFADEHCATELERIFRYALHPAKDHDGGAPPKLELKRITPYVPFEISGIEIMPLLAEHGRSSVLGFRVGNFAYLTDCSKLPARTQELVQGLDVLILDGLRRRPHKTHFTHEEAVKQIELLKPKQSYLIHLSHEIDHDEGNNYLRSITKLPVELAYDGLVIEL